MSLITNWFWNLFYRHVDSLFLSLLSALRGHLQVQLCPSLGICPRWDSAVIMSSCFLVGSLLYACRVHQLESFILLVDTSILLSTTKLRCVVMNVPCILVYVAHVQFSDFVSWDLLCWMAGRAYPESTQESHREPMQPEGWSWIKGVTNFAVSVTFKLLSWSRWWKVSWDRDLNTYCNLVGRKKSFKVLNRKKFL